MNKQTAGKYIPDMTVKLKYHKDYPGNYQDRMLDVISIAETYGWDSFEHQVNIGMVSFKKDIKAFSCRINVYLTTMSVTTYIDHPKKGKGQLYRKDVGRKLLFKIFKNPRQHTGKGYYKKKKS